MQKFLNQRYRHANQWFNQRIFLPECKVGQKVNKKQSICVRVDLPEQLLIDLQRVEFSLPGTSNAILYATIRNKFSAHAARALPRIRVHAGAMAFKLTVFLHNKLDANAQKSKSHKCDGEKQNQYHRTEIHSLRIKKPYTVRLIFCSPSRT